LLILVAKPNTACRQRRVKCGEERPRCGNCIKSKRQCEGYNQRVIFKDPINGGSRPPVLNTATPSVLRSETQPSSASAPQYQFEVQALQYPQGSHLNIAPRPIDGFGDQPPGSASVLGFPYQPVRDSEQRSFVQHFVADGRINHANTTPLSQMPPSVDTAVKRRVYSLPSGTTFNADIDEVHRGSIDSSYLTEARRDSSLLDQQRHPVAWSSGPGSSSQSLFQEQIYQSDMREAASAILRTQESDGNWPLYNDQYKQPRPHYDSTSQIQEHLQNTYQHPQQQQQQQQQQDQEQPKQHYEWLPVSGVSHSPEEPQEHRIHGHGHTPRDTKRKVPHPEPDVLDEGSFFHVPDQGMIIDDEMMERPAENPHQWRTTSEDEDDPYDISDEDSYDEEEEDFDPKVGEAQHEHLKKNDLGIMVALQAAQDRQNQSIRTYHSYIDGYGFDGLQTYRPSARSSPLNDSMTARIFCHFINVTAPCISMYERHPVNQSLIFQGLPVPISHQHLWVCESHIESF
jgi:hypothetical protein